MMENPFQTNGSIKNINAMRHFNELDDISEGIRDGELIDLNTAMISGYASDINRSLTYEGFSALMTISSSKKRSIQTAELINKEIEYLKE